MKIEDHLSALLDDVVDTAKMLEGWRADPDRKPLQDGELAMGSVLGNRPFSPKGAAHLRDAAEQLLKQERLDVRCSIETARRCLEDELMRELERDREAGRFSYSAVVKRAGNALRSKSRFSGLCVYPAFITKSGAEIDFSFGPVRVVSRDVFDQEWKEVIECAAREEEDPKRKWRGVVPSWCDHASPYPFRVLVRVEDYESELAQSAGRQAAEFVLNLLRVMARRRDGARIRLAGDRRPETQTSFLTISESGELGGIVSLGGEGAILPDNWLEVFLEHVGDAKYMLDTIADALVCGKPFTNPVVERIRYADHLIAEAFQDATDRMCLVKLVAALEALCCLPKEAKARELADRCALAAGAGDDDYCEEIRTVIETCYSVRNKVVHGDGPEEFEASRAIHELGEFLFPVVIGLYRMLAIVNNSAKPQSIKPLRRAVSEFFELDRLKFGMDTE